MHFDNDYIVITLDNLKIFEHKLNALINYSLHDVFTNHIHHKNHCRFDNRQENLEVLSEEEHGRIHNLNDFPTIQKYGSDAKTNKQLYGLYYQGKLLKSSVDKNKLQEFIDTGAWKDKDNIIYSKEYIHQKNDFPTIQKWGKNHSGNQVYAVVFEGKTLKTSVNKQKLMEYIQNNF